MESKEYFEKVMQDYNQNRKGRSLRKYCKDEAVDYDWLIQYKKNYPLQEKQQEPSQDTFIPITIKDVAPKPTTWQVETLILKSPDGEQIEIKRVDLDINKYYNLIDDLIQYIGKGILRYATYGKLCVLCFKNNSNSALSESLIQKAKFLGSQFIEGNIEKALRKNISDKSLKEKNDIRQRNIDY